MGSQTSKSPIRISHRRSLNRSLHRSSGKPVEKLARYYYEMTEACNPACRYCPILILLLSPWIPWISVCMQALYLIWFLCSLENPNWSSLLNWSSFNFSRFELYCCCCFACGCNLLGSHTVNSTCSSPMQSWMFVAMQINFVICSHASL
jgi:hypothetical protein